MPEMGEKQPCETCNGIGVLRVRGDQWAKDTGNPTHVPCPSCGMVASQVITDEHFYTTISNPFGFYTSRIINFGKDTPEYWGLALAGETGEACNLIKKHARDGLDVKDALAEELADVFIYLELTARFFGIDLERAISRKINEIIAERKEKPELTFNKCRSCGYYWRGKVPYLGIKEYCRHPSVSNKEQGLIADQDEDGCLVYKEAEKK
jgi:NTP pyrophosphatase (non-canonical NTP hydrolase)